MELIKGNLLVLLVEISVIVFITAYAMLSDSPFRQVFIFSRRQNFRYELRIAGGLMGGITAAGAVFYYLLCKALKVDGVPVWNMSLIPLAQMSYYCAISSARWKKNVAGVAVLSVMVTGVIPMVCVLDMLIWKVKLDVYCGYFILFFLAIVFFLGKKTIRVWKRGDM